MFAIILSLVWLAVIGMAGAAAWIEQWTSDPESLADFSAEQDDKDSAFSTHRPVNTLIH